MSFMPLMLGTMQQKRKGWFLNFEPFVAPDGFDRTAQPVDIFAVFRSYYSTNNTARYIFSVKDTAATTVLTHGTSYRYGYTSGGTDYVVDSIIETTLTSAYHGYYTTIQVADTSSFPATGVVKFPNNATFTYTSKTTTSFSGGNQQVIQSNGTFLYSRNLTITWVGGSTKRWVIVNNVYNSMQEAAVLSTCTYIDWIYCGNKINKISTAVGGGSSSLVKYIHIHDVDNITEFSYHSYNASLTGKLYLSVNCLTPPQFRGCTGLTGTLTIPDGITTIHMYGFSSCTGLTGLTIPNSVTTIGEAAFSGCTGFTSLTLSTALTSIGTSAFYGCSNITTSLVIPANVTSIGEAAFSLIPFSSIDVSANPTRYHVHDEVMYQESNHMAIYSRKGNTGTITFESDTLYIGSYCCASNSRSGNLSIPNGVLTINQYAFTGCNSFNGSITIPGSVTTIGYGAFNACGNATSLVLNEGLVTISQDAFRYCYKMNCNVTIPDSCVTIGTNAFNRWDAMVGSFTLGTASSNLTTIGGGFDCAFTGALYIPASVTTIDTGTYQSFQYKNNPSSITSDSTNYPAYDNVLYDCKKAGVVRPFLNARGYSGTLTLRADTTIITTPYWGGIFQNGSNRTGTLTIPATVTSIGAGTFSGCLGLTGLVFDGTPTITTIGANAFYNCPALTGTLTLPASLSTAAGSIGASAFSGSTVANRPSFTVCNSYNNTQPGAATNAFAFQSGGVTAAIPLHVLTGTSSYTTAPWTTTTVFSSIIKDL